MIMNEEAIKATLPSKPEQAKDLTETNVCCEKNGGAPRDPKKSLFQNNGMQSLRLCMSS